MGALFLLLAQAAAPAAAPPQLPDVLRRAGMSAAGVAVVQRSGVAARPAAQALLARAQALEPQAQAAARSGDLTALERVLRQRDALAARFASERTGQTITILRTLAPADRAVMLRLIAGPAQRVATPPGR